MVDRHPQILGRSYRPISHYLRIEKASYYQRLSADLYRLERTMREVHTPSSGDNCAWYQQHAAQVAHMARRNLDGLL